jgi:hypothetical protein
MHRCVVAKQIQTAIRIDWRFNRHPSTVWRADIAGYDSDPFVSRGQCLLRPRAGIAIPIDGHDAHAFSGKMAGDFQSDTCCTAGYHCCVFQLSQCDTSQDRLNPVHTKVPRWRAPIPAFYFSIRRLTFGEATIRMR